MLSKCENCQTELGDEGESTSVLCTGCDSAFKLIAPFLTRWYIPTLAFYEILPENLRFKNAEEVIKYIHKRGL